MRAAMKEHLASHEPALRLKTSSEIHRESLKRSYIQAAATVQSTEGSAFGAKIRDYKRNFTSIEKQLSAEKI